MDVEEEGVEYLEEPLQAVEEEGAHHHVPVFLLRLAKIEDEDGDEDRDDVPLEVVGVPEQGDGLVGGVCVARVLGQVAHEDIQIGWIHGLPPCSRIFFYLTINPLSS